MSNPFLRVASLAHVTTRLLSHRLRCVIVLSAEVVWRDRAREVAANIRHRLDNVKKQRLLRLKPLPIHVMELPIGISPWKKSLEGALCFFATGSGGTDLGLRLSTVRKLEDLASMSDCTHRPTKDLIVTDPSITADAIASRIRDGLFGVAFNDSGYRRFRHAVRSLIDNEYEAATSGPHAWQDAEGLAIARVRFATMSARFKSWEKLKFDAIGNPIGSAPSPRSRSNIRSRTSSSSSSSSSSASSQVSPTPPSSASAYGRAEVMQESVECFATPRPVKTKRSGNVMKRGHSGGESDFDDAKRARSCSE